MKCKKNFLFALVAFAFLICVLPAAIAVSTDNTVNLVCRK